MPETFKCEVIPGPPYKLNPCRWLAELRSERSSGLGIRMMQLVNMKTMQPTRQSWSIASGRHAKKGIHMNFCPMCGESLEGLFAHLLEPEPAPAAEPAA